MDRIKESSCAMGIILFLLLMIVPNGLPAQKIGQIAGAPEADIISTPNLGNGTDSLLTAFVKLREASTDSTRIDTYDLLDGKIEEKTVFRSTFLGMRAETTKSKYDRHGRLIQKTIRWGIRHPTNTTAWIY